MDERTRKFCALDPEGWGSGGTSHTQTGSAQICQIFGGRVMPGNGGHTNSRVPWNPTPGLGLCVPEDPLSGDQRTSFLPLVSGGGHRRPALSAGSVWWPDPPSLRDHPLLASGHLRALEGQDRCGPGSVHETKQFSASTLRAGGPTLDACFLGLDLGGGGGSRDGARRSGSRRASGGSSGCFLHALLSLLVQRPSGATLRGTAFTKAGVPGSGASGPPLALDPLLCS